MGYRPFGLQRATIDEKQNIARKLRSLGITDPVEQFTFMEALLDKDLDRHNISRQDCISLNYKLKNIKAEKEMK